MCSHIRFQSPWPWRQTLPSHPINRLDPPLTLDSQTSPVRANITYPSTLWYLLVSFHQVYLMLIWKIYDPSLYSQVPVYLNLRDVKDSLMSDRAWHSCISTFTFLLYTVLLHFLLSLMCILSLKTYFQKPWFCLIRN